MRTPALLFGVPIDNVSMKEALEFVGELIGSGREQDRSHQVATINVDFLVNALADVEVRNILQAADLCLADGMPVIWASRRFGVNLRERVTGADLVPALAALAPTTGWKIHFFGSKDGVAERARDMLVQQYPGAQITADSGPMIANPDVVDPDVIERIAALDPDILCVALGNPKQERWIAANRLVLGTPVMIGIGGTLDLLVGGKRRAPRWMQKTGTEWVFRAAQEPGRLGRRYAHDARVFLPKVAKYLRHIDRYRTGATLQVTAGENELRVTAETPTVGAFGRRATEHVDAALRMHLPVTVRLGEVEQLTPEAIAQLVQIVRLSRRHGVEPTSEPFSQALRTQIHDMGVATLFDRLPSSN